MPHIEPLPPKSRTRSVLLAVLWAGLIVFIVFVGGCALLVFTGGDEY